MKLWVIVLALVGAIGSPALAANVPEWHRLVGLQGVDFVVVGGVGHDAERDGLTRDTLQTDVELKLRQAGIRLFQGEWPLPGISSRPPDLYLLVEAFKLKHAEGLYAYVATLELLERVVLARDPAIVIVASTWGTGPEFGTVRLSTIRESVRDMVDRFINAYLAANPKR